VNARAREQLQKTSYKSYKVTKVTKEALTRWGNGNILIDFAEKFQAEARLAQKDWDDRKP